MSQFEAKVKATLDLSGISSQLQSIGKEPIVLKNVKIGNVDMSALQKSMRTAGNNVGRSFSQSMTKGMSGNKSISAFTKKWNADMAKAAKNFRQYDIDANIQSLKAKYQGIAHSGNSLNDDIRKNIGSLEELQSKMAKLHQSGAADSNEMAIAYRKYNEILSTTKNQIKTVSGEMKEFASASQIATSQNKMNQFLNSGTKAAKEYGAEVRRLSNELNTLSESGKVNASDLKRINERFNTISQESKAAGKNVTTFGSRMKSAFSKLTNYVGASTIIYGSIRTIKSGINEIVELDDALVDLKKTSSATGKQLNDFYFTANDSAKKFGTTTKDIIQGAAD